MGESHLKTPFRIEICGGIASGKTTFANLFAGIADVVLEDFTAVPFWRAFYESPGLYSFEGELSFLLLHYHQIKRRVFEGKQHELVVCDFSFSLDRAYSEVSLDNRKRRAFEAVYEEVLADIGPPQLVVHLKCASEIQMHRIHVRGRQQESAITSHFLSLLNSQIEAEMNNLSESVARTSVDSQGANFAEDVEVRERCRKDVLSRISARSGGPSEPEPV